VVGAQLASELDSLKLAGLDVLASIEQVAVVDFLGAEVSEVVAAEFEGGWCWFGGRGRLDYDPWTLV